MINIDFMINIDGVKCFYCNSLDLIKIHSARYDCMNCNLCQYYYNSMLDAISLYYEDYCIHYEFGSKSCKFYKLPYDFISELNFEKCLINITPKNIKTKINTMLTYL